MSSSAVAPASNQVLGLSSSVPRARAMALWSAAARRAAGALRCSSGRFVKVLHCTENARASTTVAPAVAAASVSLGEVIRDMKQNEVYLRGRVLFGRLSIEAEMMEGIVVSVLEDDSEAGCCCYLFICNFASSWWTAEQARMWFPKHARVSIQDPKISFGGDGVPCVELINPAALQILGLDLEIKEDSADVEKMLSMADAAMQRRHFIRAALLYSSCMQKEKASEAWLGAGLYDKALESASASDDRQSSVENLITKACALIGLHQYTSALECLQTAQVEEDDSLMKRCRRLVEHSQHGRFDLEDYYLSRESREYTPECGDYIGPVRIGMAADGTGRGLFATRELKAGEVILLCNPLAAMFDNQKLPDEDDLRAAMVRNCIASNRSLQQLVALVDCEDIPDLALFTPNSNFEQKKLGLIDIPVCAARTSVNYGYKFERVIGIDRKPEYLSGLWVMTAFANHSCAPSATQKAVGNACMMRAARDLLPGEEITLPYLDPLTPWEIRSRQTKSRWGFDCACERCKFEQQLGASFQGLGSKTEKLLDGSSNLDLFELSEIAIKVEKAISKWDNERHKHWMRASYYKAYEVYLLNRDEFERFIVRKAPPSWETIMEALRFTAPGYEGLLTLLTVFAKHAGEGSSRAKEMLVQECVSCFGELSASTLASIIQRECNELDGMLTLKTT